MVDREDFEAIAREERKLSWAMSRENLHKIELAMPPAEALTGDENWDLFLKIIQARIDRTQSLLEAEKVCLVSPDLLSHEEFLRSKISAIKLGQAIVTMEEIREIPKTLIESGQKARDLLREHGIEEG